MNKRILCIVLGAVLALCVSACSDATSAESAASATIEASASAESSASASENPADIDYNSWTAADWDAATAEEKYAATADIIREETDPDIPLEQFITDAKSDPGMDAEIIELEGLVEEAFRSASDGSTFDAVRSEVAIPGVN